MEFIINGFTNLWDFTLIAFKDDWFGALSTIILYFLLSRPVYHFRGVKSKFDALDRSLFGSLLLAFILSYLILIASLIIETFDNSPGAVLEQLENLNILTFSKLIVSLTLISYILSRFSKREREFDKLVKEELPKKSKEFNKGMEEYKKEYKEEFNETISDIKEKVVNPLKKK